MANIAWNPSFSVDHREIDRQHLELLQLMNEMESLLATAPGDYNRLHRLEILERLLDFCERHSRLELQVLEERGCDHDTMHQHWRSHKDYDAALYALYRRLLARELVLDSSILATIRHKFFNHILKEDKLLFSRLSGLRQHQLSPRQPVGNRLYGGPNSAPPPRLPDPARANHATVLFSRYLPEIPA